MESLVRLKSFGVRNLKSFGSEKQILDLKPINILVGKNSSGKSTFLRAFPLFRQSLETRTSKSPILWNGPIIDFGDFSTAINRDGNDICFDFSFGEVNQKKENVDLMLRIKKEKDKIINEVTFKFSSFVFTIHYDEDDKLILISLSNDKNTYHFDLDKIFISKGSSIIFPLRFMVNLESGRFKEVGVDELLEEILEQIHREKLDENFNGILESFGMYERFQWVVDDVVQNKQNFVNKKNRNEYIKSKFTDTFVSNNYIKFLGGDDLLDSSRINAKDKKKFLDNINQTVERFSILATREIESNFLQDNGFLDDMFLLKEAQKSMPYVYDIILFMKSIFTSLRYMAPLRAISERYYRYQNLSIEEIDSSGSNLPMYLNSLSYVDMSNLNQWLKMFFDFKLMPTQTGHHYEIRVCEGEDEEFYNISDKGFGFSQLLPIIVSIWISQNRQKGRGDRYNNQPIIYAIEQPELHLHPALQYKFGVMLANVIESDRNNRIQFIIETHSKSIIDGLSDVIKKNKLDHEQVNIYIFDKDENRKTKVQRAFFNEKGFLRNWPIGFFTP